MAGIAELRPDLLVLQDQDAASTRGSDCPT